MYREYGSSELMGLRPMVGVVPTLQCMMVMHGLGILAIERLKESCQPIMGNVPLGNDVSVPNRKRNYTRKRRSKKSMLCHGCKKSFTYKKRLLTHKQTCAGMKRLIDRALMPFSLASDPASNPNAIAPDTANIHSMKVLL